MGNRPVVPNIRDFVLRSLMLAVLEANWVKKKKKASGEKFNLEKYFGARFGDKWGILKAT